jgi:curved DNA-binding protein CbpA
MKLDSKYFDCIRVRPDGEARVSQHAPGCQWQGCEAAGGYRAPKGRGREGQYWLFCLDHVRQYNQSYNYFDGMNDAQVAEFQKDAVIGHRPTWKMGVTGSDPAGDAEALREYAERLRSKRRGRGWSHAFGGGDPHGLFGHEEPQRRRPAQERRRPVRNLERRALEALDLGERASKNEIKARFKQLVKLHHPDRNGGDKSSEEKLREIIQAYNYLKQAGLV